jgi:hypothetical protein
MPPTHPEMFHCARDIEIIAFDRVISHYDATILIIQNNIIVSGVVIVVIVNNLSVIIRDKG